METVPRRSDQAFAVPPRLASPPRRVPFSLRVRLLLGGLGVVGWLGLAITLAMTAPFLRNTDFTSWLAFRGDLETARGTVLGCRSTGASEGGGKGRHGTPVYANRYRFDWNGVEHEGVSYATGECLDADGEVAVEHLPGHPERSRIVGMRSEEFGPSAAFVLLFPLVGVGLVLGAAWQGRRRLSLLANGRLALGTLVSRTATNVRVNGRTVMRLTFALVTERGTQHEIVIRTSAPEGLEDDARERILYDPDRPEKAVAWDALPGRPELDSTGNLQPGGALATVLVLLPPLLACTVLAMVIGS